MKNIHLTKQFKKDVASLKSSGRYNLELLKLVMGLIIEEKTLETKYQDHALQGEWKGCRDCHIQGDWLLIYEVTYDTVIFYRTGSHSQLF